MQGEKFLKSLEKCLTKAERFDIITKHSYLKTAGGFENGSPAEDDAK